jgi:hypothetical protein
MNAHETARQMTQVLLKGEQNITPPLIQEKVRYPQRSWWLDECDRSKGGCPRQGISCFS